MSDTPTPLWTETELAAYLGYKPTTIRVMCSRAPNRLPPRLPTTSKLRWVPSVVEAWARNQSEKGPRKAGRPRMPV